MSFHQALLPPGAPGARAATLRLGYLSPHNPFDVSAFSGSAHFAHAALARTPGVETVVLGPHRPPRPLDGALRRLGRRAPGPRPGEVLPAGLDVVLGLAATPLLDALPTGMPFLHVTDATPAFLEDLYGQPVPPAAHAREACVAARAVRVVYSSQGIADRAAADLGLPGLVPEVIPFGLNLAAMPVRAARAPSPGRLEMLSVMTDWTRKGGDLAIATLRRLRADGLDARLTIVGAAPGRLSAEPGLTLTGWLRKDRAAEAARLASLYAQAHLFVLPTRGDCTPMVLTEAMAHGLPCLATDVGGVATLVAPGTGRLLPLSAGAPDWARALREVAGDTAAWRMMSDAARDRAATRLTWDAWARDILRLARRTAASGLPRVA